MNKAIVMLQEDVEKSGEATTEQPSVLKLKSGNFRDTDSFHKGSGRGNYLSRSGRLPRIAAWKT